MSIGAFIYNEFAKKPHFWDGNKRTAHVFAKMWLLGMNYHLRLDYKGAIGFVLEIAKHESLLSLEDIRKWLEENCARIEQRDVDTYLKLLYFDITEGVGERHGE